MFFQKKQILKDKKLGKNIRPYISTFYIIYANAKFVKNKFFVVFAKKDFKK
jgi:hypothetical protein